jgi:hypothetical protein
MPHARSVTHLTKHSATPASPSETNKSPDRPHRRRAEAESIVKAIEEMIGGHSFFSIDTGPASGHPPSTR